MIGRVCAALAGGFLASCNTSESCDCVSVDVRIVKGAATRGASAFSPSPFAISLASQTQIRWSNDDVTGSSAYGATGITHRLVSNDGTTFDSGNILPGGTFLVTVSAAGSMGYHCSIHPSMTGTLTINP
jgi:plastocyanin